MTTFFLSVYHFFKNRKLLLGLILLVILALLTLVSLRINLQEDITQIMPQDEKVEKYTSVLQNIRLNDKLVIAVHDPDTSRIPDPNAMIAFGDRLSSLLAEDFQPSLVRNISFRISDQKLTDVYDLFYRNLPLFLDSLDYRSIDSLLSEEAVRHAMQKNYLVLLTPSGVVFKDKIARDPLGLTPYAIRKLSSLQVQGDYMIFQDCIFTSDRRNLLIIVQTANPANETSRNGTLLDGVNKAIQKVSEETGGTLTADYYGAVAVAVGNARQIKQDTVLTMGIALACLLVLLTFFYRNKRVMLYMLFPVIMGALFSVAMVQLIQGELSTIAIGAGSIILGIAINYSIHFYTHLKHTGSAEVTIKDLSVPMIIGSTTTIGAFLSMLFVDSRALQDFGLFAAFVLVGSVLFTLMVLPHLPAGSSGPGKAGKPRHTFIESFSSIRFENKRWWLLAIIVITVFLAWFAPGVGFDSDMANMSYVPDEMKATEARLKQVTDTNLRAVYMVSEGKTLDEALRRNEVNNALLNRLKSKNLIFSYSSPGTLLLSDSMQNLKIHQWNDFWALRADSVCLRIRKAGEEAGFSDDAFAPFVNRITQPAGKCPEADLQMLREQFASDYVMEEPGRAMVISMLKTRAGTHERLVSSLPEDENTAIIDRHHMMQVFAEVISNDFNTILLITSLLVFVFLTLSYGRLELGLLAFIPMLISWIWILGIMSLLGIQFNIFSIILSAFIFGLGDDYSIFIMDGLLQEYKTGRRNLDSYKTAVFLSALTTLIGVGVMIFAKHPALKSIALTTIIGMLSVVMISYTVAPAIFHWMIRIGTRKRTFPVTLGGILYSIVFYGYFITGCVVTVLSGWTLIRILPVGKKRRKLVYHYLLYFVCRSTINIMFMVKKRFININRDTFGKPAMIICNHQSIIDIPLALMFTPKVIMITNEKFYNSPLIGQVVKLGGFIPSTRDIEEIKPRLLELIADGYSVFIFPEGTRAEDRKLKRFHKGAFYLAQELGLDILPLVMHGTGEYIKKGEYFPRRSAITVKALDRISPDDTRWGAGYSERTKAVQKVFQQEFQEIRDLYYSDPDDHRDLLFRNFIYKGPVLEWYMRVKVRLEDNYRFFNDHLPKQGRITDIGCGYGFLSYMLAMISPQRQLTGMDYDEEKIDVACSGISRPPNTEFFCGDALELPFSKSIAFVIADVLHYLPEESQKQLIRKCIDHLEPGGVLLIREGDTTLGRKHKGTVLTEFFSTKILGFNKTAQDHQLHFTSRELVADSLKNTNFAFEIVDDTRFTSNVIYIIKENR